MNLIMKLKFIVFLLFTVAGSALAQKADDLIGNYRLPNDLELEIFKDGNTYSGKIVALNGYKKGVTKDIKNPDKSKRNDDLLGMVIITNLTFSESEKKWLKGKLYGPEKGIIINLKITKLTNKKATAVGSKLILWRTFDWVKIAP